MYGKIGSLNPTSIPMIDLTTGEIFESVSDFCRKYSDFQLSKVCAVCRGDRFSHKGHKFAYLDKETREVKIVNKKTQLKDYSKTLINYSTGEEFNPAINGIKKYNKGNLSINNFYTKLRTSKDKCIIWNNYIWYYKDCPPEENILVSYINKLKISNPVPSLEENNPEEGQTTIQ